MAQMIEAGQRFKWFTTVRKTGRTYRNSPEWVCRCTCGREVNAPEFALRNGHAGCCYPCAETMQIMRAGGKIEGRSVQQITIMKDTGTTQNRSKIYECKCNLCGNLFPARFVDLRKGQVVACPECAKKLPPPPELGIR